MGTVHDSQLGRETQYPSHYDPGLLFPIPRAQAREELGIEDSALPFIGHDRWQAFELGWLDAKGKPVVATASFLVPATSPNLIESKSFKLYLNSFNAHRLSSPEAFKVQVERDLSACAAAPVQMEFGLPDTGRDEGVCIDGLDIDIHQYGPPDATLLVAADGDIASEVLFSQLLKSNCPVTSQPDWATLEIRYTGPRIDRAGLLRYIVSFRDHCEFHEQCVERIFVDLMARCAPQALSVQARYTRRGGLDIGPWRASPGSPAPPASRSLRQ